MDIGGTDVGCLICFDSIYDGLTLDTVRDGAEIICLSTNDSWFSGSAALSIHNSHAQLRAIESGRYISRCASTGISTVISPRGEVLSKVEADTEGLLVYDVYKRDNKTVRYYVGNVFVYICILLLVVLTLEKVVYKISKSRKRDLTL
jgi:apolipoprotein N-acyltransferase